MGIAVVGGMIFSTFLTLFVVPAIYTYISSETKNNAGEIDTNNTKSESKQIENEVLIS
jgi:predicted RND superfamily exporter protein